MEVKVKLAEKKFVEWCTFFPFTPCASPRFCLEGQAWNFTVTLSNNKQSNNKHSVFGGNSDCEYWIMRLKKINQEKYSSFFLVVYVKSESKDLYVTHETIRYFDTDIFRFSYDEFFRRFPQVVVGTKVTFIFEFDYSIRDKDLQFIDREHKSVQASCPTTSLSYLDDRHCLENLSLDLRKLLDDNSDPDVQLKCGDCTISAHKIILGARSEVFRTMLQSDMVEARKSSVDIVDMESDVLKIFIQYLYTGFLPELTKDTASPLYETGDKYHVEALKRRCSDFLAKNLTHENACLILAMADAHSDKDLKDRVMPYILDEKIPNNDDEWTKFCDQHPKLAIEVLRQAYKQSFSSE